MEINGKVDLKALQQKADEYAQKGAEEVVKEFYTSYNSPYKEAIKKQLEGKSVGNWPMGLPDIVGVLNDKIIAEFDNIANTAIAQTLIPYAKHLLTRAESEIKFSDILDKFIEFEFDKDDDYEYFTCEVKQSSHSWLNVTISNLETTFEFALHTKNEEAGKETYQLLSLPRDASAYDKRKMTIKNGDFSLEIPMTTGLLENKFTAYLASLVIARTAITIDVKDFDYEMFPKDCHC